MRSQSEAGLPSSPSRDLQAVKCQNKAEALTPGRPRAQSDRNHCTSHIRDGPLSAASWVPLILSLWGVLAGDTELGPFLPENKACAGVPGPLPP